MSAEEEEEEERRSTMKMKEEEEERNKKLKMQSSFRTLHLKRLLRICKKIANRLQILRNWIPPGLLQML